MIRILLSHDVDIINRILTELILNKNFKLFFLNEERKFSHTILVVDVSKANLIRIIDILIEISV